MDVDIYDPWVDAKEAELEYGVSMLNNISEGEYDAVVIAVAHNEFKAMGNSIYKLGKHVTTYLDMKNVLNGESQNNVRL